MSDDKKLKYYKNPQRNSKETYAPYVPQYQIEGLEPTEFKKTVLPTNTIIVKANPSEDNPRLPRPAIRQQYGAVNASPIGTGKSPVLNVGNNLEHTWAGVNEDLIDDLSEDVQPNHPMTDNNEFVSNQALGLSQDDQMEVEELPSLDSIKQTNVSTSSIEEDDIANIIYDLNEENLLLIVNGSAICSGSLEDIQSQARLLMFGEHPICDGIPIPVDDIIIIKKMPIKVGLFVG